MGSSIDGMNDLPMGALGANEGTDEGLGVRDDWTYPSALRIHDLEPRAEGDPRMPPRTDPVLDQKQAQVDCVVAGDGPPVVFVPGSFSTAAAWRPVQRLLPPRWRMVTTSLCGYGRSAETRSPEDFGMQHEVRLLEVICRELDAPVHLVGHSFGGTVALAAALSGTVDVASLSCFEANPLGLIRERDEGALFRDTLDMSRGFAAAVRAGERDAAARIIDFWGSAGDFAAMPEPVKSYCRETSAVNVLDWHTAFDYDITPRQCSSLKLPVLLVRGGRANPAMVAITAALRECLPRASTHVVEDAGHFLISSHPAQCAGLLSGFLDASNPRND
jgi:pimeloyl-ACP methyl ester carboxylesterase